MPSVSRDPLEFKTATIKQITDAAICAWRTHFGQMEAASVNRLEASELENTRLKKDWRHKTGPFFVRISFRGNANVLI